MDLFALTGSLLIATAVIVPILYVISWLLGSIGWGIVVTCIIIGIALTRIRFKRLKIDTSSMLLVLFSLIFSTWAMFKTFHGGPSGELFVGSNNVFDFGHSLGIIRSFSWGSNIPLTSPFESGTPFFYHFLFYFLVGVLEYIGLPIVWAMNIPSILFFTALLVAVYYLPQKLAGQKPFVGWVTVLLTITNSSLTFWKLLGTKIDFLHLQTYPFAGPYDGSIISIFVTLNNYVNQRHLAFSIALGMFLIMLVVKHIKWTRVIGFLTGLMLLWNVAIALLTGLVILTMLMVQRSWKRVFQFSSIAILVVCISLVPYLTHLKDIYSFITSQSLHITTQMLNAASWTPLAYLWQNLGILPLISIIGLFVLSRKIRQKFLILFLYFVLLCVFAVIGNRGFDQKFYSFLIIGMNVLAAVALIFIWRKIKIVAAVVFVVLIISGIVDLFPIKNEFAFPLIDKDSAQLISWIKSNTDKQGVFVSYADIIDPVALAGRRNYFGFFGNIGWQDRSAQVGKIYEGDVTLAKLEGVSYILVPKWQKNDFPYTPHLEKLPISYSNARFVVYAVK